MQKYEDWKHKGSSSAILEALNRGQGNNVSTFGSVDSFISGILGQSFNRTNPDNLEPNKTTQQSENIPFKGDDSQDPQSNNHYTQQPKDSEDFEENTEEVELDNDSDENTESESSFFFVF